MRKLSLSPRELLDALGHGGVLRAPDDTDAYVYNPMPGTKRWIKWAFAAPLTISALWQKQYLSPLDGHEDWFGLSEAGNARLSMLEDK